MPQRLSSSRAGKIFQCLLASIRYSRNSISSIAISTRRALAKSVGKYYDYYYYYYYCKYYDDDDYY